MKFRLKLALCMVCMMSLLLGAGGSLLIQASFSDSLERERQVAYSSYQSVLGMLQLVCSVRQPSDYDSIAEIMEEFPDRGTGGAALRLYSRGETIYQTGTFPQADIFPQAIAPLQSDAEKQAIAPPRSDAEKQAIAPSQSDAEKQAIAPPQPARQTAFPMRGLDPPHTPGICTVSHMSADGAELLAVSGTIDASGKTLYLDILYDVTSIFAARNAQLKVYRWVFILFIILCALLSFVLSYALTRPLTKLSAASRALASGQLFRRVQLRADDEIGQVAQDFNIMADALEQNILELEESLKRQKRFTGSFAHEVKTPITSIIGYADLIRGGALDEDEQRQAANYIFTEGRRLERLSQKLLQLQMLQNEEITFSSVEPAKLIKAFAELWSPVYELQGISISCEGGEGRCLLEPELVKTLLVNLWDNARKAGAKHITVRSEMISEGCRIIVQDDGQGIPPEAISHLTEAFYRADKSRSRALGGAGLGLSLCQEIVALHKGSLRFESEPGHGTAVILELKGGRP